MSGRLRLRILLPSREAVSRDVDSVNVTAFEGEAGILPGHAAYLTALRPGPAWFKDGNVTERWALGEGFLEVRDDVVTIMVQTAEHSSEIDIERARQRKAEVEAQMRSETLSETAMRQAELSLLKQLARLNVAGVE